MVNSKSVMFGALKVNSLKVVRPACKQVNDYSLDLAMSPHRRCLFRLDMGCSSNAIAVSNIQELREKVTLARDNWMK